jgi:hypothetical protein
MVQPEFERLAACAVRVSAEYTAGPDPWKGSPFAWMRGLQASPRGKAGKQLVECLLKHKGYRTSGPNSSDYDLRVNDSRVEIKTSTLWESGVYKFQQVRDQDYDVLLGLGLSPFDAHVWVWTKAELLEHVIGRLVQHGGRRGKDTAWISIDPARPAAWMSRSGGSLDAGLARFGELIAVEK